VTDAAMAERMSFTALVGHACGISYNATAHLKDHPEFEWQKGLLRNLDAGTWTTFSATQ
jgi:hypothetical protein